ncbi:hypothetical protein DFH07DRAFT_972874 [Mycena maculata]|uniref:Uncharacterized protein n=1 Tax=Mycena maculata TaxID=230809 RepID=A0AAD7HGD3_9AGAR|nr:hypothetical protein DFH07DRAFT_972874 [Mycena maculata]
MALDEALDTEAEGNAGHGGKGDVLLGDALHDGGGQARWHRRWPIFIPSSELRRVAPSRTSRRRKCLLLPLHVSAGSPLKCAPPSPFLTHSAPPSDTPTLSSKCAALEHAPLPLPREWNPLAKQMPEMCRPIAPSHPRVGE